VGGYGSGRHWGDAVRGTTAQCPALDARRLQRDGLLQPGEPFPYNWRRLGELAASITATTHDDRIESARPREKPLCVSTS